MGCCCSCRVAGRGVMSCCCSCRVAGKGFPGWCMPADAYCFFGAAWRLCMGADAGFDLKEACATGK